MTEEIVNNSNEILSNEVLLETNNKPINNKNDDFEPTFTIREMLEAGVHFGHRTARWNAKMAPYIYGIKNELHIIDLTQTATLLAESAKILREIVKRHGKILFVCTKKQGSDIVKEVAGNCQQFFVTNKWLGGMLTNWKTISKAIKTLREIEKELADEKSTLTKKEKLMLDRKREKLESQLGGIKEMSKLPDLIFVVDTPREALSIAEARSLGIPVMAITDTNSNPDFINYPIPGNDDSIKAIKLYMKVIDEALKDALFTLSTEKENKKNNSDEKNDKIASKKPSKNIDKFKNEKLPLIKKEYNVPSLKKDIKMPTVKEEIKTPIIVEKTVSDC